MPSAKHLAKIAEINLCEFCQERAIPNCEWKQGLTICDHCARQFAMEQDRIEHLNRCDC